MSRKSLSGQALEMSYKVSAREVDKLVDKLGVEPSDNLAVTSSDSVHVASLQMLAKPYETLADYVVDMNLYVADAVNRRAQLIVMPAYAGMLPMTIAPQITAHLPDILRSPAERAEDFDFEADELFAEEADPPPPEVDAEPFHELLSYCSDFMFDAFFSTMSALAARHRVCIMAGSALYFDESELCHRALLFGPEGELIGIQDKLSLTPFERALHLNQAGELKLFETPVGPVCILIGSDADYFEPALIAKRLGAKILLCPNVYTREYTPVDSSLGLNMRVQETGLYGVQSTLVGPSALGISFDGGGRIFAPNDLLRHKNGVAAKSSGRYEPDLCTLTLDLDRLDTLDNPYLSDHNRAFADKYIDRLY